MSKRIWLNRQFYISVDDEGYCDGVYLEGGLGCIVQLCADTPRGTAVRALKLPRLLADSPRENAYINSLLEMENLAVTTIHGGGRDTRGLIRADVLDGARMKEERSLAGSAHADARAQDKQLIMVRYEKGKPPRFVSVGLTSGTSSGTHSATAELHEILTANTCAKVKEHAALSVDRRQTLGIRRLLREEPDQQVEVYPLSKIMNQTEDAVEWFAFLPCIIYDWANGSLQEVISKTRVQNWRFRDHLMLIKRLLTGLCSLHGCGYLHGDLRPANVMYIGHPEDPETYVIIDYGSFSSTPAGIDATTDDLSHHIPLGPSIRAERYSPFYAPERRAGKERESADIAVIVTVPPLSKETTARHCMIRLGWRTDLVKAAGSGNATRETLKNELLDKYLQWQTQNEAPSSSVEGSEQEALQRGDRIRIRDYIFEVEWETIDLLTGSRDLCCRTPVCRVFHDRIVIVDPEELPEFSLLAVPRTIDLKQISAATDIYGIGAICLYTAFCSGARGEGTERASQTVSEITLDDQFREMIASLENRTYFQQLWPMLDHLRTQLEVAGRKVAEGKVAPHEIPESFFEPLGGRAGNQKPQTLKKAVISEVGNMLHVIPPVKNVLRMMDFNVAHFVFFIHFVLCCLHRRMDLTGSADGKDMSSEFPFCIDRFETPRQEGPATKARERVTAIEEMVIRGTYRAFQEAEGEFPQGPENVQPDPVVRQENRQLQERNRDLTEKAQELMEQNGQLEQHARTTEELRAVLEQQIQEFTVENQRLVDQSDQIKKTNSLLTEESLFRAKQIEAIRRKLQQTKNQLDKASAWQFVSIRQKIAEELNTLLREVRPYDL